MLEQGTCKRSCNDIQTPVNIDTCCQAVWLMRNLCDCSTGHHSFFYIYWYFRISCGLTVKFSTNQISTSPCLFALKHNVKSLRWLQWVPVTEPLTKAMSHPLIDHCLYLHPSTTYLLSYSQILFLLHFVGQLVTVNFPVNSSLYLSRQCPKTPVRRHEDQIFTFGTLLHFCFFSDMPLGLSDLIWICYGRVGQY